jgi:ligand-binding sensor domain-containing protein/signal transduction histidine kinase
VVALVVLACLSAPAEPVAKEPASAEWNYSARSWQAQNGLPGETVQAFAQTADGFLWVGTSEGLFRFDGANFTLFSHENTPALRENSVLCLRTGRDGRLWIGTDGGGLVEMHNGSFRAFTPSDGFTDGFIRALFEDRGGALWVATDSGLFRVKAGRVDRADKWPDMPTSGFHNVFEDHSGRIWVGAGRLFAIQEGQPLEYTLGRDDNQHHVKSIAETADGSIWVGTISGLYRLEPGNTRFAQVPGIWGTVRTLREVSGGELWAGTIGQGIFRIRYQAHRVKVTRLTAPSPLVSNTVLSIFADDARNLWIGTQVGMVRLSRTRVRVLPLPDAADSDFGTVSLDTDGSLWAASNQLVHIVGSRIIPMHFPAMGNAHVRNVLRARDGTLWIGTDGSGLFRASPKGVTRFSGSQGLVFNYVRAMLEARDGSLWIATDSGLSHLDGNGFHSFTMNNGLSHFSLRSLLQDRNGDIWVGSERGVTHRRNGTPVHDATTEALRDEKIWAEHEDPDGGLWFGTWMNGLYCLRNGTLTHYTTANGLASNSIFSILEDSNRHVWLSGPRGVMLLNRDELDAQAQDPAQRLLVRFYRANTGDAPVRFYGGTQPAGIITRGGEPWFPTNQGLWGIHPAELDPSVLSRLEISALSVDGRTVPQTASLTLAARQSRLEIGYEPVMLSSQSDLQFRYRMTGFDEDWTRTNSNHRSATYNNLPAGKYTFMVEAWEMDHPEHVVRASVQLVKQPYFYRTPWFIALCALSLGLVSVTAYQVRMKQVHDKFAAVLAERSRLAREMHDTLIQGCAGVSAMLEATWSCESDDHESRMHLIDYANTQIRAMMDEARQAIWDLRHGVGAPADLVTCIREMAQRLSREYGVSLTSSSLGESFPLGHQQTHELLMVAREAFFNAILHGRPEKIAAELRFTPRTLELVIDDDGRGFDPAANLQDDGHYGLRGVKERVERLGGTLTIESAPLRGTCVRVTVPRSARRLTDEAAVFHYNLPSK